MLIGGRNAVACHFTFPPPLLSHLWPRGFIFPTLWRFYRIIPTFRLVNEVAVEHISALLQQLRQRLAQPSSDAAGFRQMSLPVSDALSDDLLAWLAAQSTFPQFYWRHRDEQEEAAVCGALRQFSDAAAAQAFIAANPAARVWGLTAFDGSSCLFYHGWRG